MCQDFAGDVGAIVPSMRAYALALTHSNQDADDLVQDALVRAWRYRATFSEGSNFKAWVFRILRNEFFAQAKRKPRELRSMDSVEASQVRCGPDQEWGRLYGEMLAGLQRLSAIHRDALVLVGASGCSYDEVASLTGCPVGTVKCRVSRARAELAEILDYDLPVRRPATPKTADARGAGSTGPADIVIAA